MMREALPLGGGLAAVAAATYLLTRLPEFSNAATVSTTFLLIVLIVAAVSTFRVAVAISLIAVLAFNYFFLPPVGTFTIADPQNWMALLTFLAVSLVASNLSAVARARTDEARARRNELARLFDLSRDVLITTDGRDAIDSLARSVARRFDLAYVAIALPKGTTWELFEAGPLAVTLDRRSCRWRSPARSRASSSTPHERTYSRPSRDHGRRAPDPAGAAARRHQADRPARRDRARRRARARSTRSARSSRSRSSARRCSTSARPRRSPGAART